MEVAVLLSLLLLQCGSLTGNVCSNFEMLTVVFGHLELTCRTLNHSMCGQTVVTVRNEISAFAPIRSEMSARLQLWER